MKFREWLKKEEDEKEPSHLQAHKDVLDIDYAAFIGQNIPYSGRVGDKMYNMLPTIIKAFTPDDEEPTHVELQIASSNNPHLAQQVIHAKGEDEKDEDPKEADADEGCFTIPIEEFDEMLQQGWGPAAQGQSPPMM